MADLYEEACASVLNDDFCGIFGLKNDELDELDELEKARGISDPEDSSDCSVIVEEDFNDSIVVKEDSSDSTIVKGDRQAGEQVLRRHSFEKVSGDGEKKSGTSNSNMSDGKSIDGDLEGPSTSLRKNCSDSGTTTDHKYQIPKLFESDGSLTENGQKINKLLEMLNNYEKCFMELGKCSVKSVAENSDSEDMGGSSKNCENVMKSVDGDSDSDTNGTSMFGDYAMKSMDEEDMSASRNVKKSSVLQMRGMNSMINSDITATSAISSDDNSSEDEMPIIITSKNNSKIEIRVPNDRVAGCSKAVEANSQSYEPESDEDVSLLSNIRENIEVPLRNAHILRPSNDVKSSARFSPKPGCSKDGAENKDFRRFWEDIIVESREKEISESSQKSVKLTSMDVEKSSNDVECVESVPCNSQSTYRSSKDNSKNTIKCAKDNQGPPKVSEINNISDDEDVSLLSNIRENFELPSRNIQISGPPNDVKNPTKLSTKPGCSKSTENKDFRQFWEGIIFESREKEISESSQKSVKLTSMDEGKSSNDVECVDEISDCETSSDDENVVSLDEVIASAKKDKYHTTVGQEVSMISDDDDDDDDDNNASQYCSSDKNASQTCSSGKNVSQTCSSNENASQIRSSQLHKEGNILVHKENSQTSSKFCSEATKENRSLPKNLNSSSSHVKYRSATTQNENRIGSNCSTTQNETKNRPNCPKTQHENRIYEKAQESPPEYEEPNSSPPVKRKIATISSNENVSNMSKTRNLAVFNFSTPGNVTTSSKNCSTSRNSVAASCRNTSSSGSVASTSKNTSTSGNVASTSKNTSTSGNVASTSKNTSTSGNVASTSKNTSTSGNVASTSKNTSMSGNVASTSKNTSTSGNVAFTSKNTSTSGNVASTSKNTSTSVNAAVSSSKNVSTTSHIKKLNFASGHKKLFSSEDEQNSSETRTCKNKSGPISFRVRKFKRIVEEKKEKVMPKLPAEKESEVEDVILKIENVSATSRRKVSRSDDKINRVSAERSSHNVGNFRQNTSGSSGENSTALPFEDKIDSVTVSQIIPSEFKNFREDTVILSEKSTSNTGNPLSQDSGRLNTVIRNRRSQYKNLEEVLERYGSGFEDDKIHFYFSYRMKRFLGLSPYGGEVLFRRSQPTRRRTQVDNSSTSTTRNTNNLSQNYNRNANNLSSSTENSEPARNSTTVQPTYDRTIFQDRISRPSFENASNCNTREQVLNNFEDPSDVQQFITIVDVGCSRTSSKTESNSNNQQVNMENDDENEQLLSSHTNDVNDDFDVKVESDESDESILDNDYFNLKSSTKDSIPNSISAATTVKSEQNDMTIEQEIITVSDDEDSSFPTENQVSQKSVSSQSAFSNLTQSSLSPAENRSTTNASHFYDSYQILKTRQQEFDRMLNCRKLSCTQNESQNNQRMKQKTAPRNELASGSVNYDLQIKQEIITISDDDEDDDNNDDDDDDDDNENDATSNYNRPKHQGTHSRGSTVTSSARNSQSHSSSNEIFGSTVESVTSSARNSQSNSTTCNEIFHSAVESVTSSVRNSQSTYTSNEIFGSAVESVTSSARNSQTNSTTSNEMFYSTVESVTSYARNSQSHSASNEFCGSTVESAMLSDEISQFEASRNEILDSLLHDWEFETSSPEHPQYMHPSSQLNSTRVFDDCVSSKNKEFLQCVSADQSLPKKIVGIKQVIDKDGWINVDMRQVERPRVKKCSCFYRDTYMMPYVDVGPCVSCAIGDDNRRVHEECVNKFMMTNQPFVAMSLEEVSCSKNLDDWANTNVKVMGQLRMRGMMETNPNGPAPYMCREVDHDFYLQSIDEPGGPYNVCIDFSRVKRAMPLAGKQIEACAELCVTSSYRDVTLSKIEPFLKAMLYRDLDTVDRSTLKNYSKALDMMKCFVPLFLKADRNSQVNDSCLDEEFDANKPRFV